jgi:deazaflavin-dependent oxidoreductase (nitroreductase family)
LDLSQANPTTPEAVNNQSQVVRSDNRFLGMRRFILAVLLAASLLVLVFILGMRTKSPLVLNAIRRMNRDFLNPRQRDAGEPNAYASLVRHTGRKSGAHYETPVVAEQTPDGFVIALPYGSQSDWLKNVVSAGSATLLHEGEAYVVGAPHLEAIESADAFFSSSDQRTHRLFGVRECLWLTRITAASGQD